MSKTKTIIVEVTQDMIDRARVDIEAGCPLELGLGALGIDAGVGISQVYFGFKHKPSELSRKAMRFIQRFDDELDVKPDKFKIKVPA